MTDDSAPMQCIKGCVKWFDPRRGFGFIVCDQGGPDILLHANVLRNFGQNSVVDGAEVEVEVQSTPRGMQAVSVLAIVPPECSGEIPVDELSDMAPGEIAAHPLVPARVKWFDRAKGFGFANIFGRPEDVFVHVEVLRRSGFADLQPGEAVGLRVIEGDRGFMAVVAAPWEAALAEQADESA